MKSLSLLFSLIFTGQIFAYSMCLECNVPPGSHFGVGSSPRFGNHMFMPPRSPWWYPYGMYNYNYFGYPAPFRNWGISPGYYPGTHGGHTGRGAFAGKPNMYVSAPQGTEIDITLNFKDKSNLLASVPAHGKKGWKVQVEGDYQLRVGESEHTFLFYDYGFDPKDYQYEYGVCTNKKLLMQELEEMLDQLGFSEYEKKDFRDYWSFKMPKSEQFCIYPQVKKELDKIVEVSFSKNVNFTRVVFMILPISDNYKNLPVSKPKKSWKSLKIDSPKESKINVREWGVAFFMESK